MIAGLIITGSGALIYPASHKKFKEETTMKTKRLDRKLSLRKTTVANLNNDEMTVVRGGGNAVPIYPTVYVSCKGSC